MNQILFNAIDEIKESLHTYYSKQINNAVELKCEWEKAKCDWSASGSSPHNSEKIFWSPDSSYQDKRKVPVLK